MRHCLTSAGPRSAIATDDDGMQPIALNDNEDEDDDDGNDDDKPTHILTGARHCGLQYRSGPGRSTSGLTSPSFRMGASRCRAETVAVLRTLSVMFAGHGPLPSRLLGPRADPGCFQGCRESSPFLSAACLFVQASPVVGCHPPTQSMALQGEKKKAFPKYCDACGHFGAPYLTGTSWARHIAGITHKLKAAEAAAAEAAAAEALGGCIGWEGCLVTVCNWPRSGLVASKGPDN